MNITPSKFPQIIHQAAVTVTIKGSIKELALQLL